MSSAHDVGVVREVSSPTAIVRADGLRRAFVGERLELEDGTPAVVLDLEEHAVVAALLGRARVTPGARVTRTGRPLELPTGDGLLGRAVSPLGEPLDSLGPIDARDRRPLRPGAECWPPFTARRPLRPRDPIHTGALALDAFTPLARGSSVAVVGARGSGRSTLADGFVVAQRGQAVRVVLVSIGETAQALLDRLEPLRVADALAHTVVVAATDADPPALRGLAAEAGLRLAEGWTRRGLASLVLLDDATRTLEAHQELTRRRWPGASPRELAAEALAEQARRLDRSCRLEQGSLTQVLLVDRAAPHLAETCSRVEQVVHLEDCSCAPPAIRYAAPPHRFAVSAVARAVDRAAEWRSIPLLLAMLVVDHAALERGEASLDDAGRAWLEACRRLQGALHEAPRSPRPFEEQVLLLTALSTGAIRHVAPPHVRAFGAALAAHLRATAPALFRSVRALERTDREPLVAAVEAFARAWLPP